MSDIKIQPSATGSATVTLTAPVTNTARTITFPDATGTLLNSGSTLDATKLTGTIADARFPATLPTASGANLTALPAGNLTGTVADARISALTASKLTGALPAISGASLTALNATNLGSGTVPTARLGSGSASSSVFLSGANTWIAAGESNLPAFYARLNDTEAIEIPHGGVTVISNAATGDSLTEVYDSGSAFDPATGRFTPQTAGEIQPNSSGATTVNISINAIDTEGFDELLFARRAVIVSVINQAMHRQGKRGLV